MKLGTLSRTQCLSMADIVLVIIAMILSMVSSTTAYGLADITIVATACISAVILHVLAILFHAKLPEVVFDAALFGACICTSLAFTALIRGRILLIGYVYFSDLESNNPIAITAMNLAIAAWGAYIVALVLNCILGFSKHKKIAQPEAQAV